MSRRVSRTDLEQQLEMVSGIKLDFKEIPQHPEVQDLLNWELHEFTVRRGTIAGSTSPVKTPRGGSKRRQSRSNQESPRADMSATAPPRTTTQRTGGSTAATAKRHTTRATTTYDRHIRKDLILRRTTLLPGMTHDLALLCKGTLAANYAVQNEAKLNTVETCVLSYRNTRFTLDLPSKLASDDKVTANEPEILANDVEVENRKGSPQLPGSSKLQSITCLGALWTLKVPPAQGAPLPPFNSNDVRSGGSPKSGNYVTGPDAQGICEAEVNSAGTGNPVRVIAGYSRRVGLGLAVRDPAPTRYPFEHPILLSACGATPVYELP
ncbi:hypothetical protein BDZ89DRAFT_1189774 [Hymenopellis radicata]|nr:hypothetical protein BDZ89DRAFT_1189774 [Hymenopellis radicata]